MSAPNKQIMALAAARWDANTCAASPLLHTCLRPIFGSYVAKDHAKVQSKTKPQKLSW